jgi:hypothetical protein
LRLAAIHEVCNDLEYSSHTYECTIFSYSRFLENSFSTAIQEAHQLLSQEVLICTPAVVLFNLKRSCTSTFHLFPDNINNRIQPEYSQQIFGGQKVNDFVPVAVAKA